MYYWSTDVTSIENMDILHFMHEFVVSNSFKIIPILIAFWMFKLTFDEVTSLLQTLEGGNRLEKNQYQPVKWWENDETTEQKFVFSLMSKSSHSDWKCSCVCFVSWSSVIQELLWKAHIVSELSCDCNQQRAAWTCVRVQNLYKTLETRLVRV